MQKSDIIEARRKSISFKIRHVIDLYGFDLVSKFSGCSKDSLEKYININAQNQMHAANYSLLSIKLQDECNDFSLAEDMIGNKYQIVPTSGISNGTLKDDAEKMFSCFGNLIDCFNCKDKVGFNEKIKELQEIVQDVKKEGESL